MKEHYDVVVVGAGMVGATLAAALEQSSLDILLLDRAQPPEYPGDSYELRVSAINVGAQTVFERLGVFDSMSSARVSPMRSMYVWDEAGNGSTSFSAADIGEPHLGHIVENNVVTRALVDHVAQTGRVDTAWPVEIESLQPHGDGVTLTLTGGASVKTKLVVGADGARSIVRDLAGIETAVHNYNQRTLVAIGRTERDHQNCAWQRFLKTGPLAFLPLANGLTSVAWHADNELAESLREMSPDQLEAAITERSGDMLGAFRLSGPVGGFPLIRMHAPRYFDDRVVLIGDAAHAIHPLAGLGANIGFMDAATLCGLLLQHPLRDPGDPRTLRAYDRARRAQNSTIVGVTDTFKHVFGSDSQAVEGLRNFGLKAADRLQPAKHAVIRYAMGIDGDLPELARR